MSRKHKDKGKIESPFIAVLKPTWECPAWRAMSLSARILYIALKARYSYTLRNNGRIYLSTRQVATETGMARKVIIRSFRELQYYAGSLSKQIPVALASKVKARPHTGA